MPIKSVDNHNNDHNPAKVVPMNYSSHGEEEE